MSGSAASSAGGGACALGGLGGSLEDKDCELLCPVCFELIEEAYVTRCGHSFCYACIAKAVEAHRRCPKCGAALASRDHIFPNFLLNELVAKRRLRTRSNTPAPESGEAEQLRALLAAGSRHLALADLDSVLEALTRRKRVLEAESAAAQHRLLYEFLSQLHRQRAHQLEQLAREAALVEQDMEQVKAVLKQLDAMPAEGEGLAGGDGVLVGPGGGEGAREEPPAVPDRADTSQDQVVSTAALPAAGAGSSVERFAGGGDDALAARWRRLAPHFDDFVQSYLSHRARELYLPPRAAPSAAPTSAASSVAPSIAPSAVSSAAPAPAATPDVSTESGSHSAGLWAFRAELSAFTRHRALRPVATLSYCSDAINYSTIVSTIEFDKDDEFFAIAGVTKRIKVFEFEAVVRDAVDVHYPCAEMQCAHKISCVSWNAYHKHVLASSDYEGTVSVWDAHTGQRTRALQEHDKRCWSVHFNRCDVRLLASGSDDARVKLWALNQERSVATLEAKFNVCCVRFNPKSSAHLAFGSADHCVHYYDLRAPRHPLAVFRDHRKAVSYVKFLDADTLVSASTDSQLKLWKVDSPRCVRNRQYQGPIPVPPLSPWVPPQPPLQPPPRKPRGTSNQRTEDSAAVAVPWVSEMGRPKKISFTGHTNEKNFVGLATDGKYVACGSENNALYVYYCGLSRPMLVYRFEAVRGLLERERRDEEPSEFVSAVCWRRRPRPALLAANSQGSIKVLELV